MRKRKTYELRAQSYEHRIECAIQALVGASSVVQKTSLFLVNQLGDDWRNQDVLLRDALEAQRYARMWLKKALKK